MSSISAAAKNLLLASLAPDTASLHTGFPGVTGANECSSPRQAVTFGPVTGGTRNQVGTATFSVASQTVRWIGYWIGSTWLYAAPAGGSEPKNFVVLPVGEDIECPLHGWSDGRKVAIFNGTPPGGVEEGRVLFVRDSTVNSFKLSLTNGGAVIDMTSAPSWGAVIAAISEFTYPSAGTFRLENSTIVIPD